MQSRLADLALLVVYPALPDRRIQLCDVGEIAWMWFLIIRSPVATRHFDNIFNVIGFPSFQFATEAIFDFNGKDLRNVFCHNPWRFRPAAR